MDNSSTGGILVPTITIICPVCGTGFRLHCATNVIPSHYCWKAPNTARDVFVRWQESR